MDDFLRALLGVFAAVAPFGALPVYAALAQESDTARRPQTVLLACLAAFALLAGAALVADPLLDWLDVSPENFQFAAGLIMSPLAARLLLTGRSMPTPRGDLDATSVPWLAPLALPLVAGPAALAAAMTYAARYGVAEALIASAAVLALTAVLLLASRRLAGVLGTAGTDAAARLSGALLIVIAVELAVDGVRSV